MINKEKISIEELEKMRLEVKKISFYKSLIITPIIIILIIMFFLGSNTISLISIVGLILATIVAALYNSKNVTKYRVMYKENFVKLVLQEELENLIYKPYEGIQKEILTNTGMIYTFSKYYANDYISAEYKGVKIKQSNVHILKKVETNKRTSYVTMFRGNWTICEFNKNFRSKLQIYEKGFAGARNNGLFSNDFKKIELEDSEFNDKFVVYAENEQEAFYIITPQFMNKIKRLNNNISGKMMLCFYNNRVYIGLNNGRDSFEPNINKKIDKEEIRKDIKLITAFIDELDIEVKLFK